MKKIKLLAALLALTIGLAGCGNGSSTPSSKPENRLDGDNMIASNTQKQEYEEPEDVMYMRLLAGEDEYRACVLYLGGSYEITTDVQVELYPSTGEELVFSPSLSGENGHVVQADGVCDFTIYPDGDDWETDTSP